MLAAMLGYLLTRLVNSPGSSTTLKRQGLHELSLRLYEEHLQPLQISASEPVSFPVHLEPPQVVDRFVGSFAGATGSPPMPSIHCILPVPAPVINFHWPCRKTSSAIHSSSRTGFSSATVPLSTPTRLTPSTGATPGAFIATPPARSMIVAWRSTRWTVLLYHWPASSTGRPPPPMNAGTRCPPSQCENFIPRKTVLAPALLLGAPLSPRKRKTVLDHMPLACSAWVKLKTIWSTVDTIPLIMRRLQ
mmetsp:Transcript_20820/g.62105  ORF Transcript_20820/g.62105 Transcript_20820/m.62105 type:complete len:247 (-) Transcript_20820:574-1314(-)